MKPLFLASTAAAAFAFGPAASAQTAPADLDAPVVDCGRIDGTVRVTNDDPIRRDMARVSLDDATEAVLRAAPGASVTDLELDEEDGHLVYEADLRLNGAEVTVVVDAGTGAVLCSERD